MNSRYSFQSLYAFGRVNFAFSCSYGVIISYHHEPCSALRFEVQSHRTELVKYLYPAVKDQRMMRNRDAVILDDLAVVVDLPVFFYVVCLQFSLIIHRPDPERNHGAVVRDLTNDIKVVDTFAHDRIIAWI